MLQARAVQLSDPELGITGKIDLVEVRRGVARPVDTKKGKRPHVARGVYDPERVQVCAQGLLLRKHGYSCDEGEIYFAGSRERVRVPFDAELLELTHRSIIELRRAAQSGVLPPPLDDSPKCVRCSLAPICMPDEVRLLQGRQVAPRRLIPGEVHRFPLYVEQPGAVVRKNGDQLEVYDKEEKLSEVRILETSQVVLGGRSHVTEPALRALLREGIPVVHVTMAGWLDGISHGPPHRNIDLRRAQYRAADDPEKSLAIARRLVRAKLLNQRTLLRRNAGNDLSEQPLRALKREALASESARCLTELMGHEGAGARAYFAEFSRLIHGSVAERFAFEGRNRRPPRDRVNALLSFAYSMLCREWVTVCLGVGLEPYLGFLHRPRYGRPALALDLMEAFRPLVADSVVIRVINNGEVADCHFLERMGAVELLPEGRRAFLRTFEQRLAQEITHPIFGYRISYRRVFEVEARLLSRHLMGEISSYDPLTTR